MKIVVLNGLEKNFTPAIEKTQRCRRFIELQAEKTK